MVPVATEKVRMGTAVHHEVLMQKWKNTFSPFCSCTLFLSSALAAFQPSLPLPSPLQNPKCDIYFCLTPDTITGCLAHLPVYPMLELSTCDPSTLIFFQIYLAPS